MDFSGDWAPVQDEDNTGNPYVGEFLGIPMSQAGSLRAQAWNASLYTLPEWQCRPHGAMYISRGPSQVRIWKEIDPNSRPDHGVSRRVAALGRQPVLHGRPRASAGAGAAHVGRLFHGGIRRRHAEDHDDAPQRGLLPAQRRAVERRGDADAVLDSPRRHPDLGDDCLRPAVSGRADDPQQRVPVGAEPADSAVSRARRSRKIDAPNRASCRTTCRARTRS